MSGAERRLWAVHDAAWRDPASVVSLWPEADRVDPALLRFRARGKFWDALEATRSTLIVSREYEHLLVALSVVNGTPRVSHLSLPHPSGLAYDEATRTLHVAATRNPNQIFQLRPAIGLQDRSDVKPRRDLSDERPLIPVATRFYPGSTYLHDLAMVGGRLHANAVGENAVVRVEPDGSLERAWWPRCIDGSGRARRPRFERNYLQLNSIAPAESLHQSFFTASIDRPSTRRPGQRHFAVDGRGVLFSGKTREPVARGLTRPHSARLFRGRVWLANSGYGELGVVEAGRFESVSRLPGWTRGLVFKKDVAFVATSRVIPRFAQYAPGLDLGSSRAAVTVLSPKDGTVLGSVEWPSGNQIFGLELVPRRVSSGLPFLSPRDARSRAARQLFYAFRTDSNRHRHVGGRTTR